MFCTMKKILMVLLIALSCSNLAFAEFSEKSVIFRTNVIYVDEILGELDEGDNGAGPTVEISFLLGGIKDYYQTIGFEAGYIKSDVDAEVESIEFEAKTELVPLFLNYTIGDVFGENTGDKSGFLWEAGFGLGGFYVDVNADDNSFSESNNDFIFGGQIFGSIGYGFSEVAGVLLGARYMIAEDGSFDFDDLGIGVEGEVVNSFAIDFSLNYTF